MNKFLVIFKKPILQLLEWVLLFFNILLGFITIGMTLLNNYLKSQLKLANSNGKKALVIIINIAFLGLPYLNIYIGKGINWIQGQVSKCIDTIKE